VAIALRIVAAVVVALISAVLGGLAGVKLPDYDAHDMAGPFLGLMIGAGGGFFTGLVGTLVFAFLVIPPKRKR